MGWTCVVGCIAFSMVHLSASLRKMTRPDDAQFREFSRCFESIDTVLKEFARTHHFKVEKNPNRIPCRILRRVGNPHHIVDIYQEAHWRHVAFSPSLLYNVAAAAFYTPDDDTLSIWKLNQLLLSGKTFAELRAALPEALERADRLLEEWTVPVILEKGERHPNLMSQLSEG